MALEIRRAAVLDIGTNAIKFLIAEKNAHGDWETVLDTSQVTRLGQGLHSSGLLNTAAMERSIAAIQKFLGIAREQQVDHILAVGTMALRTAANAQDFVERLRREANLNIQIIDGEEEARLSWLAVISSLPVPKARWLIFDVGGGSTEFILSQDRQLLGKISLNIGVVRLTEQILISDPVTDEEVQLADRSIKAAFQAIPWSGPISVLVGVGATMTTLGAMQHQLRRYQANLIHGLQLSYHDVTTLVSALKSKTIAERKRMPGLPADRADVILAGGMIVSAIMKQMQSKSVIISDRGVRHGLLIDRFHSE
ncbi:MAG: Ppx/GppA family phosphatase [candidate division KSB1 bacterium]|nr:Ppx/GppA family phosphatase [candidate division KSB1 bacterium]MDZ7335893.1 Ppx/GppA family phosphatase [candidate division KSB1 bacterium]MDZ7356689.1 Ppx/GppA family phosphatase [candidate division KSB1 bacterium]MDZ7398566.1 Ppx/GppA family phosphatase [candidate division KSB1 bacterium]